ncbi:MAG: PilZ domain-containing protein [Thermodesulfobacteriota bacterium]
MANNQPQKVFVKDDGSATIHCRPCGQVRVITLKDLAALKPVLNVKCGCGAVFPVRFEYRKFYRKATNLAGVFCKPFDGIPPSELVNPLKKTNCRVENISMHGAGFVVLGRHMLQPGEQVFLGFMLDNQNKTWVEKSGIVRLVEGNCIGMEFDEPANNDKALGFYLRP